MTYKESRKRSGLTIKEYAVALGIGINTLYRWERGEGISHANQCLIDSFDKSKLKTLAKSKISSGNASPEKKDQENLNEDEVFSEEEK